MWISYGCGGARGAYNKNIMSSYKRSVLGFLALVMLVGGGWLVWNRFFGPNKQTRQLSEAYKKYISIYRDDVYGGKTPQETLDLFIKALEENDVELASKYFMPDENGSREEWRGVLEATREVGNLPTLISALGMMKPEPRGIIADSVYEMTATDKQGKLLIDMILKFNGNIWKIDALF